MAARRVTTMKSFVAHDMRSALRMVREELGEDAVILSNRRVAAGIELVAAAEMPNTAPAVAKLAGASVPAVAAPVAVASGVDTSGVDTPAARQPRQKPAAVTVDHSPFEHSAAPPRSRQEEGGLWQMQQELRSMRDLIEQQYSNFAWQQYRVEQPGGAAMWRRLQRLGLDLATVRELMEGEAAFAADAANARLAWQQLMGQLTASIPTWQQDLVAGGGVYAFVGPTGAGKTTTIGKLAARYVLERGNTDIALITTDSYRIGAHEQLRTLSRILNVPCRILGAGRDLATVLHELRHCRLVLIDTAGLNARAPELRGQLAMIEALGERANCLQVLAANSQQQALVNAQRTYRTSNLAGCVLTKLDEAGSLGEVISLLVSQRLPLAYMADGQAIPGDIAPGDPKRLVAQAIALAKQAECDEERLADAFAASSRQTGSRRRAEKALSA